MKIYLVGGAVRDKLLGLVPVERDWVVVGATPDEMIKLGYKQVGRDFPVFLHPDSYEEYALARTERKTAPGYTGFAVHAAPDVTLEQDLIRRDLTINAIAEDADGNLIDPFNGQADLQNRLLRHVSPAFSEDPVRILRAARFAARFHDFGFTVASETNTLMKEMVAAGEVDALVSERVWKELEHALQASQPQRFFEVLRDCDALARLLPEIDCLFGVPQPEKHHPEIDTGIHTLMVLQQAARLSDDTGVRLAALLHDLGKGTTPKDEWPRHIAHEERGVKLVKALCKRLRVPNQHRDLAVHVCRYHLHCHRAAELKASTMLKLFQSIDALRQPERFEKFLLACKADAWGRTGFENSEYPQVNILAAALKAVAAVESAPLLEQGLEGKALGQALDRMRTSAIEQALSEIR